MISMHVLGGGLVAAAALVVAALALTALFLAASRVSRPGQAPSGPEPRGGTRPDFSPEPWPDAGDPSVLVPDDARELTGDRELLLV